MEKDTASSREKGMPPSIWALGFVSMFMDISSEMIHSLLPVFLVTVLGALSKPLFAMAPTASWVLFARFTDRLGKGIRGGPGTPWWATSHPPA